MATDIISPAQTLLKELKTDRYKNLQVGQFLSAAYSYEDHKYGSFDEFTLDAIECRKVKDPLTLKADGLVAKSTIDDAEMYSFGDQIKLFTTKKFKKTQVNNYYESEDIDFKKYKEVFSLNQDDLVMSCAPKDVFVSNKSLINIQDFSGINAVSVTYKNIYVKTVVTVNGNDYFTLDKDGKWISININDLSVVKEQGVADISKVTPEQWSFFAKETHLGFGFLLGIGLPAAGSNFDGTKEYSFSSYSIDYVGESTATKTKQYFNFIYAGNDENGSKIFIADRNIQEDISFDILKAAKINDGIKTYTVADTEPIVTMRLLKNKEYETFIAGHPEIQWNDKQPAWTAEVPTVAVNAITVCNGEKKEYASSTASGVYFRPVLEIGKPEVFHRDNSETTLTISNNIKRIVPGQAIRVAYYAPTKNTPGTFSVDSEGKTLLPDIPSETADGYFYFICVGYDIAGNRKLVADRNIQNYISWEALNAAGYCTSAGVTVQLGPVKNVTMRLPGTLSSKNLSAKSFGEWDAVISTQTLDGIIKPSSNDVWNAATMKSWTLATPQENMANRVIRGKQEESFNIDSCTQDNTTSTITDRFIGFRPIALVPESAGIENPIPECKLPLKSKLTFTKPGEAVSCCYTADTDNVLGTFSMFGTSIKPGIPEVPSTKQEGTFYWVNIGYDPSGAMKFVADRNLQGGISWETLNTAGLCTSSGMDVSKYTKIEGSYMRLLESSVCNNTMDRRNSEWDAIIYNQTIGASNKDAALINNWSFSKARSWVMNTPSQGDAVGNPVDMAARIARGCEAKDYSTFAKSFMVSSTTFAGVCFRPVLIIPTDKQSVVADTMITPTHTFGQNVQIHTVYDFMNEEADISNTTFEYFINDKKLFEEPADNVLKPIAKEMDQEIPFEKLSPGDNEVKIVIKSGGISNELKYKVIKEIPGVLNKYRDFKNYAGGFTYDGLQLADNKVINPSVAKAHNTMSSIKLPKNIVNITLED